MILRLYQLCSALVLLSVLSTSKAANETYNGTFMVLAPGVFRPGLPYVVWLNLLSGEPDNIIRIEIRDKDNQTIAQKFQHNVAPGSHLPVELGGIPAGLSPEGSYSVYVRGETLGGRKLFEAAEPVRFEAKAASLFVQTDKAIYKPGSLVHFRVVAVNPDLMPLNTNVTVKVYDQQSNVILQETERALSKGVYGRDLQLSDEPPLGAWRIDVETPDGLKISQPFTVEKYVLPKFEVIVQPPSYSTVDDDITVRVKAKYTYGKGVEGRVTVMAEYPWRYYGQDDGYGPISHSVALDSMGEASVRFRNSVLKERKLLNEWGYNRVKLTATVVETLTGIERNGTADVVAYKFASKVKITKPSETFKPGLPYDVLIAAVQQDDTPIPARFAHTALLNVEYEMPYVQGQERTTPEFMEKTIDLDEDGTAKVSLSPPAGIDRVRIEVRYDDGGNHTDSEVSEIQTVNAAKSPSKSFIQIKANQGKVALGETLSFGINTTQDAGIMTWMIMSRGRVLLGDRLPAGGRLEFPATAEMAPKSRLVVYALRDHNKEILVDAMDFHVHGLFKNKVSVSLSTDRAEPGASMSVVVRADPDSYVGLLAIDQSVLLLKSGNDITPEMVEADVAAYDTTGHGGGGGWGPWGPRMLGEGGRGKRSIWLPWWGIGGKDASSVFSNAGIKVLTDALLYKEPVQYGYRGNGDDIMVMEAAGGALPPGAVAKGVEEDGAPAETTAEAPRVRSEFPETWLWVAETSGPSGELRHETTVPDTITSWITSAFAVSETSGLGVAPDTAKLEVFRPFFIRLNTPYSVKRGENIALQVLVFNYMSEVQWVTVTLDHNENSGFEFVPKAAVLGEKEKPVKAYNQRKVRVASGGSATIFFPIVPSKIGELKLKLSGVSPSAGDAIEAGLLVEPEGFRVDRTSPIVLDLTETDSFETSVAMDVPAEAIEGSARAQFSLIGDVMGPVLSTAENLVRMPYGCGEQNMVNFVPNIVVVKYLTATNRLSPALEKKALSYMEAGYQRELTYKRSDNSFSAFGDSDAAGSTWLTAFVVRSFTQASPYIFVDSGVVNASIAFLLSQQKENGEFEERGEVHHKAMQGGAAEGGVPLTAYVLVALLEAGVQNRDALNYVEQNMAKEKDSAYSMAIVTYALDLAGSPMRTQAAAALEELAIAEGTLKHWSDKVGDEVDEKHAYWNGPRPVDVEATAYGLLSIMRRGETAAGLPVVRWLTSQRSALGGYSSTQDTVMALQALGAYAEAAYSPNFDVSISLENGEDRQTLSVGPDNAIILQSTELTDMENPVKISATGSGMAFGQVSWSYHVAELPSSAPFHCDQDTLSGGANDVLLSLCCKYKKAGKSNMAVLELDALSGFALEAEKLNGLTGIPNLQRVELANQDTKANFYFSSLSNSPLCFNVSSQRVFGVSKQKPAMALLYDYYDPSDRVEMQYTAKREVSLQTACPTCWDHMPTTSDGAAAVSGGLLLALNGALLLLA